MGTDIFTIAFNELSNERETAPGSIFPIKRKDIREWCRSQGWGQDLDFVDELTSHVLACDAVWRELEIERIRKEQREAQRRQAMQNGKGQKPK